MDLATFDDERAVPCSCDPRIAAVLDAADRHVEHITLVLDDNDRVMATIAGTTWSSPALVSA